MVRAGYGMILKGVKLVNNQGIIKNRTINTSYPFIIFTCIKYDII